ncbi:MAG: type I-E CRISPR-associated protein Cse2/CasB [Aquabacterium sp.]
MTADKLDFAAAFVAHLRQLHEHDKGAMAILRRSLSFDSGSYPPAYPFVERFVGAERHAHDPLRRALYCVAALFAQLPHHVDERSLASAFGAVMRHRESASIESRFIALLSADAENLPQYLRHVISLLSADDQGFDFAQLLRDLTRWLNPYAQEARDQLRQRWARDFYNALSGSVPADSESTQTSSQGELL